MDPVVPGIILMNRRKCIQSNVQSYLGDLNPFRRYPFQEIWCEMQASGWRSSGSGLPGVDRLIPFRILEICLDIWR